MARKLAFYANRSTPKVVKEGERPQARTGYGTLTRVRQATPKEEAKLDKGKWLRVDVRGNNPSSKDYKETGHRPGLAQRRRVAREKHDG